MRCSLGDSLATKTSAKDKCKDFFVGEGVFS